MVVATVVVVGAVLAGAVVAGAVVAGAAVVVGADVVDGVVVAGAGVDGVGTLIGPPGSVGRAGTVWGPNATGLFALPAALSTRTAPVVEPIGTVAVTCVFETVWNWAGMPLKVTPVNWKRLNPVIVTTVSAGPSSGQIDEIDGLIVSGVALMAKAVPRTDNWPVVASVGTVVVI